METQKEIEFIVGVGAASPLERVLPLDRVHMPWGAWSLVPRPLPSRARRRRLAAAARCASLGALLLAVSACSPRATPALPADAAATTARVQQPRIQEITFQSGEFTLVGDLQLPAGTGPFPAVRFVHGNGEAR